MPYSIDKYSGSTVAVVEDGTINNSLDIKLIGKNYAGFGEAQNENFVWLLENFAGSSAPARPITGQLWYDSSSKRLKVFNGTNFKSTSGIEINEFQPIPSTNGEFWFDTANKKLYAWSATDEQYQLIGPQRVTGFADTVMESAVITDVNDIDHPVVKAVCNGEVIFIISNDVFVMSTDSTLPASRYIQGFTKIRKGINLRVTNDDGVTVDVTNRFWGTATDSDRLGGRLASEYATKDGGNFSTRVKFSDLGYVLGDGEDLEVKIDADGTTPLFNNRVSDTITFKTTSGSQSFTPLKLVKERILPEIDNINSIGSATLKYKEIHAYNFKGEADRAQRLYVVGGVDGVNAYVSASVAGSAYTVAARDAEGNLTANTFLGTSSRASGLLVGTTTVPAADFVHVNNPVFSNTLLPVILSDIGFKFGATSKLRVFADGDILKISTSTHTPLTIAAGNLLPGNPVIDPTASDPALFNDIGAPGKYFRKVYAKEFIGSFTGAFTGNVAGTSDRSKNSETSDRADLLKVYNNEVYEGYSPADIENISDTIPVRLPSAMGPAIKTNLIGHVVGNVTGNLTGNVTGNLTGNVTGNLTGNVKSATGELAYDADGNKFYGVLVGNADTATTADKVTNPDQSTITKIGTLANLTVSNTLTVGGHLLPSASGTVSIGSSGVKFNEIYANKLYGEVVYAATAGSANTATIANTISGQANSATIEATPNNVGGKIVQRDSGGNFSANIITGTATQARYADLAEKYLTDCEYEVGTVVVVGGDKEVTASMAGDLAIGVISENPAYMMNSELEGGQYVALKGRVPVKVVGKVKKGDRLIAANGGAAISLSLSTNPTAFQFVFGVALEASDDDAVKFVEAVIL